MSRRYLRENNVNASRIQLSAVHLSVRPVSHWRRRTWRGVLVQVWVLCPCSSQWVLCLGTRPQRRPQTLSLHKSMCGCCIPAQVNGSLCRSMGTASLYRSTPGAALLRPNQVNERYVAPDAPRVHRDAASIDVNTNATEQNMSRSEEINFRGFSAAKNPESQSVRKETSLTCAYLTRRRSHNIPPRRR